MKKDNLKNISKNKKVGIISSLIMIFITTILAFDFMGVKSLVASKLGFLASGDVPAHTKSLTENGDGTYKLSLDVTGDAEKKQQKVNVIVIVDRSGSMDEDSGTTVETYTPSNDNGDPRYGLVDGKYVRLTRQGGWGNRTYWYNGVQYTGQRYIRTEADQNRMEATRSAVNNLAESLLSNNGKDGNPADTVEMALVSFATNARTDVSETTSYSTFSGAVNGLNPNGGTNWEAALQQANGINFGDNDPTYVIFFSDGAPTFHSSNGGYGNYNRDYGVYGSGYEQEPNMGRSYDQAKDDAATLATKVGKDKFYTIFAYGENYGATYMSNLTTAAGAPSTNNYSASNTVALQQAFAEILEKIEMAGIASVEIEDGTTEAVKIETTDENGLLVVDSNSFAYSVTLPIVDGKVKIRGQEATLSGNTLTWGDKSVTGTVEGNKFIYDWTEANDLTVIAPPPAEDQSGKVVWDLKDAGVLINEATYRVTFDAWPSQETYDLIADLKNGTKKYSDLPQNVKDYLGEDYKLKTNTTAKLSYNDTRNTNGKKEAEYVNPNPVSTNSSSISIKKEWENELDSRKDRPVTVSLNRDGSNFITINLDGEADDEWESKPWEATNITIATGLARLSDDGKLQILDNGHDYKFSELGSEAYNWELETETVHPMLINGSLKKLILVENTSEVPAGMGDKDYYDGYYKLANGKVYKDAGTSPSIKAINHRRSNLNIKKVVNGENANPNDTFEFTINVTQKDEKGQALPSTDTENYNDYLWFSVYGKDGNTRLTPTPNNWTEYQDPKTGEYYYHAPNGTDLVVQLKDGDNLRFTNLVSNTDFSVVEGNTTNYSLESITTPEGFTGEKDSKTITESSKTITGHIGENNTSYQIEYKNKNDVPETVNVPVEKIWDDVEDGVRPESVEVQLKADDEDYGDPVEIKVDANGKWKYTFEGLPKYSNGKVVEYTVSENTDKDNIKDHYETTIAGDMTTGYTITNKRNDDDKTVNVSVEKIWDDIDDGVQPTSVTVTLLANGEKATVSDAEVTIEADASGNWKYEWKELAKYIEGNEVTYSVSENTDKDNIKDHYDTSITGSMTEGYKITNTRKDTDKTVNVKVEKVWDDIDDGVQPTSVTVTLLANGKKANVEDAEVTLEADASGNWKYEWKELAKYIEGQEVTYTVSENTDKDNIKDHYETTITGDMTTGYTIANKRNDDDKTVDVSGTKSWDDNNNQDGKRADIVVNLMKTVNGTKSRVDSQTVKLSGTMTYEWTELPKYENGVEIVYSVEEEPLAGYEASYDGYDILNTHIPETKDITIEKEWSDNNDQDGIRPATITVQLLENGTQIQELTLSAENNWKETVKDLPVYKDGAEITYSVTESPVDGYTPDINGLHIKNTHNVDKTSVCVTKEWKDDENRDGLRPEEIAVELLANGSPTGRTFTLNEGNGWTATVEDLDKNSDGEPIKYSFKENDVPEGYEVSYSSEEGINEGEFVVTNTHEIAKTKVEGKKTWSDNNNQDGKRTAIIVNLMKTVDGKTSKVSSQEVPLGDDMTYKFEDLPQFEGGKKIDYSVEEEPLAGYEASYDGYDILNTHIPETKDITIEKEWIDNDNQDGVRPATITVQLLENGTQIKELTLSAENGWKETVKGLPVYKDGDEITYSVTESSVDGYTPDINGLHIKNTHNVAKTSVCVTKEWKDDENRDGLRPEEIAVELLANGSPTGRTFTLNEGNEWSATVEDLDKNSEGSPIKYSFQEVSVPEGYGVTYSSEEGINEGEFVVTNTHEIAKTKVEGKKTWSDNDNQDGKRTSIIVNLMKTVDGKTSKVSSQEVPLGDDMTYKFDDLPQFEGGKEIKYSVEEEPVTGYEPTYEGYNILNTHEPEKTEVTVTKKWNNDNNVYGFETPSKVTVELVVNGEVLDDAVLEEANNWTHTFTDLDKYSEGSEIPYNVREVNSTELTDYTVSYGGSLADGYIITNTYEPTTHPVEAVKVWNDNLDQDGIRPDSIEITLIGKVGENTVYTSEPVVLSGDMNAEKWTHTFTDIPQYYLGETIDYSIEEKIDGEDYTGEHTKALEITNSYTPQTVNYTITKTWEDNDNQDGKRPGAITVYLYDGEELLQTVEISEANGWTYDFTGLPKYKNHGEPIDYRIVEKPVPEYTSEVIDENTEEMKDREVNVINTHIPERIMIVIEKAWDDENNKHTFRPANIEVVILANGKEFRRVTLSEENNWKYVADDLFKYENGELITYTVEEVSVEHYTTSYENKEYEFKIKNTVIAPPEITPPNTFVEVMNDESKEDVISLLALILIFISTLAFKKVNG